MATHIVNFAAWRSHVLSRLQQQFAASGDAVLRALETELAAYPAPLGAHGSVDVVADESRVAVPLLLNTSIGRLAFMSMTTVFGTPVDVTLSELALETFFPADDATASSLRLAAESRGRVAMNR